MASETNLFTSYGGQSGNFGSSQSSNVAHPSVSCFATVSNNVAKQNIVYGVNRAPYGSAPSSLMVAGEENLLASNDGQLCNSVMNPKPLNLGHAPVSSLSSAANKGSLNLGPMPIASSHTICCPPAFNTSMSETAVCATSPHRMHSVSQTSVRQSSPKSPLLNVSTGRLLGGKDSFDHELIGTDLNLQENNEASVEVDVTSVLETPNKLLGCVSDRSIRTPKKRHQQKNIEHVKNRLQVSSSNNFSLDTGIASSKLKPYEQRYIHSDFELSKTYILDVNDLPSPDPKLFQMSSVKRLVEVDYPLC